MQPTQGVVDNRPKAATVSDQPGRVRVIIEGVRPEIDGGRFPVKRVIGDTVAVAADIFCDGHDAISAVLRFRKEGGDAWSEAPMRFLGNDRWRGEFTVTELGRYQYTLCAWVDHFKSWRQGLVKKVEAGQDVAVDLLVGSELLQAASRRATGGDAVQLRRWAEQLASPGSNADDKVVLAQSDEVVTTVERYPNRELAAIYPRELTVVVDREKARFSAWYEMFPRSCSPVTGRHGNFQDAAARLPYVASMGFDVLYLPPIHPIGRSYRKGKNNSLVPLPEDPGVPWAIGATEGGHKAIHPDLGTLEDFQGFVRRAGELGIDVALDVAFQCAPDHPYVTEHPAWFKHRPDGTIQYAENPPKRYEDIYPFDFESEDWPALWEELKSVFQFWIQQGVSIFRMDNPHTKAFPFWEWVITEIKRDHPEVIFLAEAFTRPRVMERLAKLGFSQSYTYFAWRNSSWDLTQYLTELTRTEVVEYFRPNLWPNTPDILTEYLQTGGRGAFMARLVLAATLGASYGIYGPAFELGEHIPREPGSEEYLDSEKYQLRHWDLDHPDSLKDFIARINQIRRENPALHRNERLRFHPLDNEQLICYSKSTPDHSDVVLVVVNLDPYHTHSGWTNLSMGELGLTGNESFQAHDLLTDAHYLWQGARNYVELNPQVVPAHVCRLTRRSRTERDFDYYL